MNKNLTATVICALALDVSTTAMAAPVDNPGDALFTNISGVYDFITFSTTEHVGSSTINIYMPVDGAGNVGLGATPGAGSFGNAIVGWASSLQTVSGVGIDAQLFITDIAGTIDMSTGAKLTWTITAYMRFRSTSMSPTIPVGTCNTSSFTINISGDFVLNTYSSPFTIPTATGCNGHAAEINSDFGLGNPGAKLRIGKWSAENTDTGLPLFGS